MKMLFTIDSFDGHYIVVKLIAGINGFCFHPHFIHVDGFFGILQYFSNSCRIRYTNANECEDAQIGSEYFIVLWPYLVLFMEQGVKVIDEVGKYFDKDVIEGIK